MILGVTWPFGMKVGKGDIIGYGVLHINRHAFRQSRWAWTMCFFYMSLLLPWIAQCSSLSVLHPVTGARECGMIQREKSIFLFFNSLSKKKASWTGRISFCWELAYSHQLWLGSLIEENSLNIQHWNRELVKGTTVGWKEENQRPNDWIKGSACGFCYGFFHRMNKGGEATRKAMPLCRRG